MTVRIYNTLTQRRDEIKGRGLDPMHINMYVCGPTVYDSPHVGHARSYVFFDTLRRVLLLDSYSVNYIQNFSDVDEKIDLRASRENVIPSVISERYKTEFLEDMDELNVLRSDVYTSASHVREFMHTVTGILLENGSCYRGGENIYFDSSSGGNFGSLLHDRLDNLISGNEADGFRFDKRDKEDFVIWLGEFKPGPHAESKGRPSWNLECFSIVHKQVGCELDIQGGGMDLIFPHHEVASVLSKSYCDLEFANYYIHNAFVTIKNDKMSKSTQNYVGTRELLRRYGPEAMRLYLLSRHFRENIEYDERQLMAWKREADTIGKKLRSEGLLDGERRFDPASVPELPQAATGFTQQLHEDMHSERAVDLFSETVRAWNGERRAGQAIRYMAASLGLFGFKPLPARRQS